MAFNWILHPVVPYVTQVLGLVLCLYLFFSLKREARVAQLRAGAAENALEGSMVRLRETLEEVKANLRDVERHAGMLVAPAAAPSGLNLSKRRQALRMYRRGESAERIAASLALPRREVDLLVKVQQLLVNQ